MFPPFENPMWRLEALQLRAGFVSYPGLEGVFAVHLSYYDKCTVNLWDACGRDMPRETTTYSFD